MTHSLHFGQPIIYYPLAGLAIAAFAGLAIVPSPRALGEAKLELFFIFSMCAALFACRWPSFLWPDPFNVDEGTFIACALKATVDWVPWRGFDASTSGPLNCYVLLLPALFGADIGWFSARVVGLCLIAGALCSLYYTVKWIYGAGVARLSMLPPVFLLSLTKTSDFLHYSSEQFPIFLMTVPLAAAAFLARGAGSRSSRLIACATAGLFLGCPFLAKIQAAPIALAVLISLVAGIITSSRSASSRKVEVLVTGAGLVAVPSFVLIILGVTGGLTNAVISYYKMTLVYKGKGPPVTPSFFFLGVQEYNFFALASLAVILCGAVALYSRVRLSRSERWALLSSILLLVTALFAIYYAHHASPHYLLFSIIPLSFCVANVLGLMHRAGLGKGHVVLARSGFAALFLAPIGFAALTSENDFSPQAIVPLPEEVLAITRYVKPGDRLVVWAWRPEYYVKTKTIMAVRDSGILPLMQRSRYREYLRERFMSDLRAQPPPVIVDAVAPRAFLFDDRATQGIENFPQLHAFVQENYTQREEVAGVRIFVAKNLDALRSN
jgi:hypothetical protein